MFGRRRASARREQEPEAGGKIGYYQLTPWWLGSLSVRERGRITEKFGDVTSERITHTTRSAAGWLTDVAGWLVGTQEDRLIARKLLLKAEQLATKTVDKHFVYGELAETYYKDRETDPNALAKCIEACEKQIALAPEAKNVLGAKKYRLKHAGFQRLRIIYSKQKMNAEGLELCSRMVESGWYTKADVVDWKETFEKRLAKTGSPL